MSVARTPLVVGLSSVIVTAVAVLIGLSLGETQVAGDSPAARPTARSTPLASFDTQDLVVARASFCSGLQAESLTEALGGQVESSTSYGNGEAAQLTRKIRDVAHEFDCTWRAADGTTARAWVFAPPVTRERATDLVDLAQDARGCAPMIDAAAFGMPSTGVVCRSSTELQASYRGLFGDAWLSCSITASSGTNDAELVERAGRWCVAVVSAAS